jgi:hypothetical protein
VHLATHLLTGWALAGAAPLDRKGRAVVAAGAVVPDLDALGFLVEHTPLHAWVPGHWFSDYHHVASHNVGAALAFFGLSLALCRGAARAPLVALGAFHLHLLADIAGSRGPDGFQWPVPYLLPFSDRWQLTWSGQWALNGWPNALLTVALLALALRHAWSRGYSPVELVSRRADAKVVEALRGRFGAPGP